MDDFKIPTAGTRFTYTRYRSPHSEVIEEQWTGTVECHYIDDLGENTVVIRHRDGTIETFWNGSFAGTPTESIEIMQA